MDKERIISMYKQGFSMGFITKKYYKYMNKNSKPIILNGVKLFPPKIYTMDYCRVKVYEIIYEYLINGDLSHTKTIA